MIRENEECRARDQADLDNLLRCREKEMSELKDAYKEKHRKCQAWEKVLLNLCYKNVESCRFNLESFQN
jgi:hypothetical protein